MAIKKYGIYLAYAPTVDLRKEGLGRYLAAFIKGSIERDDIKWVIACPSWTHKMLDDLFKSELIPHGKVEIVAPKRQSIVLRIFSSMQSTSAKKNYFKNLTSYPHNVINAKWINRILASIHPIVFLHYMVAIRNPVWMILYCMIAGLPATFLYFTHACIITLNGLLNITKKTIKCFYNKVLRIMVSKYLLRLIKIFLYPQNSKLVLNLFDSMRSSELLAIHKLIDKLPEIQAWYCPTAFWPSFNTIKAPCLLCVPDNMLQQHPIGFSLATSKRMLNNFVDVQRTIHNATHFVTYSETIKWNTLVKYCHVPPKNIKVVRHAPNNLQLHINLQVGDNTKDAQVAFCHQQLSSALKKAQQNYEYSSALNSNIPFIFYPTQFRPTKNIINLLRAYQHLHNRALIKHKLILTSNCIADINIREFIQHNHLEKDVLCLHGLTTTELASCYSLADLAVTSSLFEGAMPFTFTEALSVGTPVVMSRISVAEEVLEDKQVQEVTFFDPYNYKDIAAKINWALNHQLELLTLQQKTYERLQKRSWQDVVNEHIEILDSISAKSENNN